MRRTFLNYAILLLCIGTLAACGGRSGGGGGLFGGTTSSDPDLALPENHPQRLETENTIWNIFNRKSTENVVLVNRYIWAASLEVLDFLPIQTVDPYTGVIVTGYGTPPGGGRSYRATVLIDDPALDARSLNVSLQTRSGTADPATVRAIEDAILTRARQLRVADNKL
ncbi:DUF3576 domain-containing protein [Aliishimia ponticola]|uniref:DUF3576 domain-containing protein n=1 Tax=Aliishimia ponticola TaxID=2499833 RepID=A0A4S4NCZ2_9RHOB|nr:DUF3576 domain-containing protein [Aliishimia ponticola]THH36625.1 DUF3576 domain-containing protein [Aliishimia ponticola]